MLRAALRFGVGSATLLAGGWVLRAAHGAPEALGATPAEIAAVARRSPHYVDGAFVNVDPASGLSLDHGQQWQLIRELVGARTSARPGAPIPLVRQTPTEALAADLGVRWFGHSSALVEVDGYRLLTDPVWSDRCSPSDTVGPQRMHDVPIPLEALPAVDAVLVSHDHYDHLDIDTIIGLARTQRAPFCVPLGVGAHLRTWGIPEDRIVELDWNESYRIDELTVVCTPARHFSGRSFARNSTLWGSWVITGPRHCAFFGGDTGYTKSFAQIGSDHGPFDLTLLPVGAYHRAWPDIHMNPEEAVRAHLDMAEADSGLLVPIHWATFRLALHPWAEPIERLVAAAGPAGVRVVVPKPGQRVVGTETLPGDGVDPWWEL